MSETKVWTIRVDLEETSEQTEATATLEIGDTTIGGWGRARRNPHDPDVPRIGEELATARALADMSHKLIETCAEAIEQFEGHRVTLFR